MSHRPNRMEVPHGAPGTRNDPARVAKHERKIMGKHFRNIEREVVTPKKRRKRK